MQNFNLYAYYDERKFLIILNLFANGFDRFVEAFSATSQSTYCNVLGDPWRRNLSTLLHSIPPNIASVNITR